MTDQIGRTRRDEPSSSYNRVIRRPGHRPRQWRSRARDIDPDIMVGFVPSAVSKVGPGAEHWGQWKCESDIRQSSETLSQSKAPSP